MSAQCECISPISLQQLSDLLFASTMDLRGYAPSVSHDQDGKSLTCSKGAW